MLMAFALSMDAFAVSISSGILLQKPKVWFALELSLFFGVFQSLMPLAGHVIGDSVAMLTSKASRWLAFLVLALIGLKMIYESTLPSEKRMDPSKIGIIISLAFATSIDAFSAGFSLSLVGLPVMLIAVMAGTVTFAMSFSGVYIGSLAERSYGKNMGILGGIILIAIGIKILSGSS